jgi:hypothetical protein
VVTRVAVLGLYNSGSTGLAGMLHRLGANMGPPFWANDNDRSAENYYEPNDLAWHLRRWWKEPSLEETVHISHRIEFLRRWIVLQELAGCPATGAKHPLLSISAFELAEAWGPETVFVWSWRDLDVSIAALQRREWFGVPGDQLQRKLWEAITDFQSTGVVVHRIVWDHVRSNPRLAAGRLSELTGLRSDSARLDAAADFILHPPNLTLRDKLQKRRAMLSSPHRRD